MSNHDDEASRPKHQARDAATVEFALQHPIYGYLLRIHIHPGVARPGMDGQRVQRMYCMYRVPGLSRLQSKQLQLSAGSEVCICRIGTAKVQSRWILSRLPYSIRHMPQVQLGLRVCVSTVRCSTVYVSPKFCYTPTARFDIASMDDTNTAHPSPAYEGIHTTRR
jgi:hypothetical protein